MHRRLLGEKEKNRENLNQKGTSRKSRRTYGNVRRCEYRSRLFMKKVNLMIMRKYRLMDLEKQGYRWGKGISKDY